MLRSPRAFTFNENNPSSVNRYSVYVTAHGTTEPILASRDYPVAGPATTAHVGSDGFFDSLSDGLVVDAFVIERAGAGQSGDDVTQPIPSAGGNGFTLGTYPDGVESITVQL